MDHLKDRGRQTRFRLNLTNRLQALQELYEDSNTDIAAKWEHPSRRGLALVIWMWAGRPCSTQNEIHPPLYRRSGKEKTGLNSSRTRSTKAAAQKNCNEAHGEVKTAIRADKRGHIDNLARQAEDAAAQRNLKGLHDITRKLAGRCQQADKPVKESL